MGSYVNTGLVRHSLHKRRVVRMVPGVRRGRGERVTVPPMPILSNVVANLQVVSLPL